MSDWGSTTSSERNQLPPSEVQGCQANNCTLEADVLLRSSDGVIYAAHSKNLELYSDGFPPASFAGADEIVQLTETSPVLSLLLKYLHCQRQPDSSNFELLAGLAEAAEKYMVYSAMEVCKIQMCASIAKHPLEVMAYATKHDYPELRDAAAPKTVSTSLVKVSIMLHDRPDLLLAWVKYREGFIHALHFLNKGAPVLFTGEVSLLVRCGPRSKRIFWDIFRGISNPWIASERSPPTSRRNFTS